MFQVPRLSKFFAVLVIAVFSKWCIKGPFKCYITLFFWKLDPHPPPRNANNIEHYTFVTLFSRKSDTPHPHLHYVTLEWPLIIIILNFLLFRSTLFMVYPHWLHTLFHVRPSHSRVCVFNRNGDCRSVNIFT